MNQAAGESILSAVADLFGRRWPFRPRSADPVPVKLCPELETVHDAIVQREDWARALALSRELKARMGAVWHDDQRKFLQLEYWLRTNLWRAEQLNLHTSPPLRILDLGAGNALFVFVCCILGHDATGLDQPADEMPRRARRIYPAIADALSVPMIRASIRRFERLPVSGAYDLITAYRVCFNNHRQRHEWGAAEWSYFVGDARCHLQEGGQLIMWLNRNVKRYGRERQFYDAGALQYFRSVGTVAGARITVPARNTVPSCAAAGSHPAA